MAQFTIELNKDTLISYAIKTAHTKLNSIGDSKSAFRKLDKYKLKTLDAGSTSIKMHSHATLQSFKTFGNNLEGFLTEKFPNQNLKIKHLTPKLIEEFAEWRKEDVSDRTLKNDLSQLNRLLTVVKITNKNGNNPRDIIPNHLEQLSTITKELKILSGRNRAFKNPIKVVNSFPKGTGKAIATIQYVTGMRLDDAVNASVKLSIDGNRVKVINSKGGKNYHTTELSAKEIALVKDCISIVKANPIASRSYSAMLQKASKTANEKESGSHSFRYNYAQRLVKSKRYNNTEVSQALGHERESITAHYIKP